MKILKFLLCVFLFSSNENIFAAGYRRCFDCVSMKSCDMAMNYARMLYRGTLSRENREIFLNSLCGYSALEPNVPKVCCSDFADVQTGNRTVETGLVEEETPAANPIETHRNIALLPSQCGDIDGTRIINGSVAKLISYYSSSEIQFRCAGSVINSKYILTAAHCVINVRTGKFRTIAGVRIGELDYNTNLDCQENYQDMICEPKIQDIGIEEIIPHENFTGQVPVEDDIALLRLNESIKMYNNAAPICLPIYRNLRAMNLTGMNAIVARWVIMENHTESSKLKKANILIKSSDTCNSYYKRSNNQKPIDKAFCAGSIMKDSCDGDSSGPLMVETDYNESIRLVQFGIVSYGPIKCGSQFPDVYTDVRKYMDWILDHIKE